MKTLGLIGGLTWHSTVEYYRTLNQLTNTRLGGMHSSKLLLYSVDFEELKPPSDPSGWAARGAQFAEIARRLEAAGADAIVLCANTAHPMADDITRAIGVPLIHIGDVTARAATRLGVKSVGLLGTHITMEAPFLRSRLDAAGIQTLIPDAPTRDFIHASIFNELAKGLFLDETRARYVAIIRSLAEQGAEAVILGCAELPLLLRAGDSPLPTLDTLALHAAAAVDFALGTPT